MNRIYTSIAMLGITAALGGVLVACSGQTSTKDFNNQGVDKLDRKDYAGAIEDFNQALQLNPHNTKAYFNRGFAYANLEKYQNAIDDYTHAIEGNPQDADAYYNRGLSYSYLENDKAAIEDLQKAAQLYQQKGLKDGYQDAMKQIEELKQ